MSGYRLSGAALGDLRIIWRYTAETRSEAQADRFVALLESSFTQLASGELRGRPATEFRQNYFRLTVGSDFVFYTLPASGARIFVVRILHQRMDAAAQLGSRK